MSEAMFWCRSCVRVRSAGEVLLVTPVDGGLEFHICRPVVSSMHCIRAAGRRDQARISFVDPVAAREWDFANAGPIRNRAEVEAGFIRVALEQAAAEAVRKNVPRQYRTEESA